MKYALISDIHGNLPALKAVINDARENKVDHFIFLGDYCIGLGYPNEVVDCIRTTRSSYIVSGNEDEVFLNYLTDMPNQWPKGQFEAIPWVYNVLARENRNYLCGLPNEIIIKKNNRPLIFAFHKPQRYFSDTSPCTVNPGSFAMGMDENRYYHDTYDTYFNKILSNDTDLHSIISKLEKGVYIYGHTHIPLCWEKDGRLLISPGSCGLPLDFNRDASYGILEWTGSTYKALIKRVAYDVCGTIDYTRNSTYGKEVRVWSGIISKELETAREQAVPFICFTEKYASEKQDHVRPFRAETWYAAYDAWSKGLGTMDI